MGLPLEATRRDPCADHLAWPRQPLVAPVDDRLPKPGVLIGCDPSRLTERGVRAPGWILEVASPSQAAHDIVTKRRRFGQTELTMLPGVRIDWEQCQLPALPAHFPDLPSKSTTP